MEIGGAERALLGLLETIDTKEYSVDLFLMRHSGELMKYIPKEINVLPENPVYAAMEIPIIDAVKCGHIAIAAGRLIGKIKARKKVKELQYSKNYAIAIEYSHKYTWKVMPKINEQNYDLAISFLTPHYYIANKVQANKRVAWIHTDYYTMQVDVESELKMWDRYDIIISISRAITESFCTTFPSLKNRIVEMENIMPMKSVELQSKENIDANEMPEDGSIKLLSIGRFCYQKNFDSVPAICKSILQRGINVKWYLIGFGIDERLIRTKIEEEGIQNQVIILGKKENPYPYIKMCDIYVQPSRMEGKSVAVREAQILHKPVVITNFSTAKSQLQDGYDGIIVPMDIENCAKRISELVCDQELQRKLIENTKTRDYTNASEILKFYELV